MIKQAIIPLAGLGTRLLPLTSVFAKELLPINGKPYGRELKRRYDEGDENIFFVSRKPKHIYVYYLDKRIKRQIKKLDLYK